MSAAAATMRQGVRVLHQLVLGAAADDLPSWQCSVKARLKASRLATLLDTKRRVTIASPTS